MAGDGMNPKEPVILSRVTAAEICRQVRLTDEAAALLRGTMAPLEYVRTLVEKREHHTAARVLAQALSKRAAVWWGCQCLWQMCRPLPTRDADRALSAAMRWVLEPNDKHRRAAGAVAETVGLGSASGCLALAACWSGGSMTPPELPSVAPPPFLCGQMAAGCVLMLEAEFASAFTLNTWPQLLSLGLAIAEGRDLWDEDTPGTDLAAPRESISASA